MRTQNKILWFVIAPDIPAVELFALRDHIKAAIDDPEYTVVVNYAVAFNKVEIEGNELIVVSAPGIPESEIPALEGQIKQALAGEIDFVILNYDVRVDGFSRDFANLLMGVVYEGTVKDTMTFREKLDAYRADPTNNNLIVMNRDIQIFQVPFRGK